MTNTLIALLSWTLTTNWTSVSRTSPVLTPQSANYPVIRYDMLNQTGQRFSNLVATIVWKGQTNAIILESLAVGGPTLQRSIADAPSWPR